MTLDAPQDREKRARRVFATLSPHSLLYARHSLVSLFENALERFDLRLITDSGADKEVLSEALSGIRNPHRNVWSVYAKEDLRDREAAILGPYPHLRRFREGHPCWRKVTDPLLLSIAGEEIILLDPDVYFPNHFTFETTPDSGLLLMWQRPNCLSPPEVVNRAFENRIPLADHVDIGVAHWRAPADLEWLDWLLQRLGSPSLPPIMHIEAVVWAALAMRMGGGHLDPQIWRCWHRSQIKRVLLKVGVSGARILRSEPFAELKCFHAGGEAKHWIPEAKKRGRMDFDYCLDQSSSITPFVELTAGQYRMEQQTKQWLRRLGYYRIFRSL